MPDNNWPLAIAWVLAAAAAVLVHRNATVRQERLGRPPAGLHPLVWALLVFFFGLLGLLFYGISVLGQDRGQQDHPN
jgi:hypothetical protein